MERLPTMPTAGGAWAFPRRTLLAASDRLSRCVVCLGRHGCDRRAHRRSLRRWGRSCLSSGSGQPVQANAGRQPQCSQPGASWRRRCCEEALRIAQKQDTANISLPQERRYDHQKARRCGLHVPARDIPTPAYLSPVSRAYLTPQPERTRCPSAEDGDVHGLGMYRRRMKP